MMRLLVLITMMMAGCSSPYNLSAHRPTSRWAKVRGPITVIHLVESLTPEQARGVAKDRKGTLYLPDLRTIDKGVAAVLAAWERGGKRPAGSPLDSSDHRSGEQEAPVSPEQAGVTRNIPFLQLLSHKHLFSGRRLPGITDHATSPPPPSGAPGRIQGSTCLR